MDDGARVGALARVPTDPRDAAGAELHERAYDYARRDGMASQPAVQRAPDAGIPAAAPADQGVTHSTAARWPEVLGKTAGTAWPFAVSDITHGVIPSAARRARELAQFLPCTPGAPCRARTQRRGSGQAPSSHG